MTKEKMKERYERAKEAMEKAKAEMERYGREMEEADKNEIWKTACRHHISAEELIALPEEAWLAALREGCRNIGRTLSDTRGLTHSFLDCRKQILALFEDLRRMAGESCLAWQLAFELRLKRSRHVRIYADVLVITEDRVFSLEFKMKKEPVPEEVEQAAKYVPYLEILFGPRYEIIPVLVLTGARELFSFVPIGEEDRLLPVCSGDMLFTVFDESLGFLN